MYALNSYREEHKIIVQHQCRLNNMINEVVRKKVIKWLDAKIIYPIYNNNWVSPVECVPKKGIIIVVRNKKNELISIRTIIVLSICMDYQKLIDATKKNHYPVDS